MTILERLLGNSCVMFMSSLQNALIFTIHTIVTTYIMIVLFRFLLQLVRADFRNPLAQFAVKITNPLLVPMRRIIPGFGKIDFASIVLALILQAGEQYIILFIKGFSIAPHATSILGLFIWSIGELADLTLTFLFFVILLQVILSWIQHGHYNPNARLLEDITAPLYRPVRRMLPNFGALDFSPLILIFIIYLCRMVIVDPIVYFGKGLI